MKYGKGIFILILVVFLFSIAGVCASEANENVTVSNEDISVDEDVEILGTQSDEILTDTEEWGSFSELNAAIAYSGSELKLNKSYRFNSNTDGSFKNGIEITKNNYVIDGQGHTIDGANQARMFYIGEINVILKNITFVNGYSSGYGGAIDGYNHKSINCTFIGNHANNGGALSGGEAYDCIFTDNIADENGGALYHCNVDNCTFIGNSAYRGGAFYQNEASNCRFINNTAGQDGGAIYDAKAHNCTFVGNGAMYGGAFYHNEAFNCTFISNTASEEGGAIYDGKAYNCTFVGNGAKFGGAFYHNEAFNCTFVNNTARQDGGAIYEGNAYNCTFVGNGAMHGGALYHNEASNCRFINNTANSDGGAIYEGNAYNCIFVGNGAKFGGAFYHNEAYNCTFINNTASQDGGAVWKGTAIKCNFTNNNAKNGQAMYGGTAVSCFYENNTEYNTDHSNLFNVADYFYSKLGSGDKLSLDLRSYGNYVFNGLNVTIRLYKGKDLLGTYYAKSGDKWLVDLPVGVYTACLSIGSDSKNVTIKIIKPGTTFTDLDYLINKGELKFYVDLYENYTYVNGEFPNYYGYGIQEGVGLYRVTIDGHGVTIDGANAARFFSAWQCTFKNIIFINGMGNGNPVSYDNYEGFIFGENNKFINCTFINNQGGLWYADAYDCTFIGNSAYLGGAMRGGNAYNCTFINNTAGQDGGAIYDGKAYNCTFVGNGARYGGAFYHNEAFNCTFINNTAGQDGGAIFDGKAYNCTFVGNGAKYGGALYQNEAYECTFISNTASEEGGAVWRGTAVNCNFTSNYAEWGQAMFEGTSVSCFYENNTDYAENPNFLNVGDFYSVYGSGDKLLLDLRSYGNYALNGWDVTIRVYKGKDLFGTYYAKSGEEWLVDLPVGVYTASFNVASDMVNITLTIIEQGMSFSSLNQAINGNNDTTIDLYDNYTHCSSEDFKECIEISRDVTIDGHGITIDACRASRIFNVVNGTVTFKNIIFKNGYTNGFGGAVTGYNHKSINCTFIGNHAKTGGALSGGEAYDCIFTDNVADENGGALHDCKVDNCTFISNSAYRGGAIVKNEASNCRFINNTAGQDGGAIYQGKAYNCTFVGNGAKYGGAFYQNEAFNCTFINNTASEEGGAIWKGTAHNCIFEGNHAKNGDDIYEGTANNCTFLDSRSTKTFKDLYTDILQNSNSDIYLDSDYIYDSNKDSGFSGVTIMGRKLTIHGNGHVIDAANSVRIFTVDQSSNVVFKDLIFKNAKTDGDGGAINGYNHESINCTFINNNAGQYGGAMNGGSAYNCTFINNHANDYGGAMIYGNAYDCTFIGNSANRGGAMDWGTAVNCIFEGNHASIGGGVYQVDAVNCIFDGNTASYSYGAICLNGADSCIFKTPSDICNLRYEYRPTLYVSDFTSSYNSGDKLTFDFKTHSGMLISNRIIKINIYENGRFVEALDCLSGDGWVVDLPVGSYVAVCKPIEYDKFDSVRATLTITKTSAKVICPESIALYNTTDSLAITVTDNKYNPIRGINVAVEFNGIRNCTTDENGQITIPTKDLPVGNYSAKVIIGENRNFIRSNSTVNFSVIKANSSIVIPEITLDYGESEDIEIAVEGAVEITAEINGKDIPVSGFIIPISGLNASDYTLKITTVPDVNHNSVTESVNFTVSKIDSSLAVDDVVMDYGSSVNVTATAEGATGITVKLDGEDIDAEGYEVPISSLNAGSYNLTVTTVPDSNHNAVNRTVTVTVRKVNSTVEVDDVTLDYGAYVILAAITEGAEGISARIDDDESGVFNNLILIPNDLDVGNHTLTVTTVPDENHISINTTATITVRAVDLFENTAIDLNVEVFEDKATATVYVNPNATGFVKFEVTGDEEYVFYMEVMEGKSVCDNYLEPGNYSIAATYMGDSKFLPNTTSKDFTIVGHIKKDTHIRAVPVVNATTVTITADVDVNATGSVTIDVLGQTFIVPVEEGKAVFTYDFFPGTYTAGVAYTGDDDFNAANTTVSFTIIRQDVQLKDTAISAEVSSIANDVTITAEVDRLASGLVEFNIDGHAIYLSVNNGEAVYDVNLPAGEYTVVVTYLGDDKYNANSTSKAFTVTDYIKSDTPISADAEVSGHDVTLTVNVDESATGFVEFEIAGNMYYAPVVGGKAVIAAYVPAGTYDVSVTYLGDGKFNENSTPLTVNVIDASLENTTINLDIEVFEDNAVATVNVNSKATGFVKFEVTGDAEYVLYMEMIKGESVCEYILEPGNYAITATYLGDSRFNANTTSKEFTVVGHVKKDTTISAVPSVDANTVTVTVNVNESATGFVTIDVLNQTFLVPVENGMAVFKNDFLPGTYTADVAYTGDDDFNGANTAVSFTVVKQEVQLKDTAITADVSVDGNSITVTAGIDSSATGLVEFNINGKAIYLPVNNGEAVYEEDMPVGEYVVVVTYLGDARFNGNSTSKSFSVKDYVKLDTAISADAEVNGHDVTVNVNVDESATGFVEIEIIGNAYFAQVSDGKAVITTFVPAGTYDAVATYLGDDKFNGNSTAVTVNVIDASLENTTIDLDVEVFEDKATATVHVDSSATGFVRFEVTGDEEYVFYMEVRKGKSVCDNFLEPGNYAITATYMGDSRFNTNTTSREFTILGHVKKDTTIKAVPRVDENTVTITASVDSSATGFVTIDVLGQTFIVPVEDGNAVFTYDFFPGTYNANVVYMGDDDYNSAATKVSFTVIKQDVQLKDTAISAEVDVDGNNVTITANVDNTATGLIEFNINGKAVYLSVNSGEAVYNVDLPVGEYELTATYLGDDKFNGNSTSKSFTVEDSVKQNTSISTEATVDGHDVTLTVNVNESATGFVEFVVIGNAYYAPVADGKAVITTFVPAGIYEVSATYLGDDKFNGNSTAVTVNVIDASLENTTIDLDVEVFEDKAVATVNVNPKATGFVRFEVTGDDEYVFYMEMKNGKSICDNFLEPGNYTISATYMGDSRFNANTTSKDFTIVGHIKKDTLIKAVPEVNATTVTIAADVDENATGFVTIDVLGQTFIVPVEDGKAVFTYDFFPGTYNVYVAYSGDDDFNEANTTVSFTVIKQDVSLKNTTVSVDVSSIENDIAITANVDSMASGLVEFNIDGKAVYLAVNNGEVTYNVNLPAGDYNVVVTYLGDEKYNANSTSKAFSVTDHIKRNTTVSADAAVDGYAVTITVNVDGDATGSVTVDVSNQTFIGQLNDGKAVFTYDFFPGTYNAIVTYLGDDDHNEASTGVSFNVTKQDEGHGQPELPETVVIDGVEYPVDYVNGTAVVNTNKTEPVAPVTVVVDGVVYSVDVVNGTAVVNTNKTEPVVPVSVVVDGVVYSVDVVNGTAVVNTNKTEPVAPVTVVVDGVEYPVDVVNGTAVVNTNKTEPDSNVTVVVDGKEYSAEIVDGKVTIKTDSIEPVSNERLGTVIIADDFEQYSCDYYAGERGGYFTAQLKDSNGNPLVNKTVLIGYNGINFNRTTNETGWIAVQIGLQNAGLYTFGMSYLGDDNYNASFLVKGINIVKKPTSIVAKDKKFKAKAKTKKLTVTLKTIVGSSIDGKAHLKEGKLLTLKVNGKTYKAKTDANGKATFKIKNLNKKGIYIAKIAFKGDTFVYEPSSKKVKLTVK